MNRPPQPSLVSGGDSGARTRSLRLAKPALSQLSYIPVRGRGATSRASVPIVHRRRAGALVGLGGLEPPTSRLSGVRSNQLSYRPTPSQSRGGDRARRGDGRPHCPPSPWVLREPEPGRVSEGQSEPGRRAGQAQSRPQAPEREKNSARATKARRGTTWDLPGLRPEGTSSTCLPRKEVIQPHLPVRLPCYDFVPVTGPALGGF